MMACAALAVAPLGPVQCHAMSALDDLLQHRLILVTGKGGTGKTTLAAALALAAAKRGRRTLAVEYDPHGAMATLFGEPATFEPRQVGFNLWASNIDFISALKAYVMQTVKIRRVVDSILDHPIVRRFLDATPSAREITTLMQVQTFALETDATGRRRFDNIIVDLAASGHAVMLLKTPVVALQLFTSGPVYDRARQIAEMLQDPAHTSLVLAALPEDLSVSETIETAAKMRDEAGVGLGPVLLNRMPAAPFSEAEETAWRALREAMPDADAKVRTLFSATERATVVRRVAEQHAAHLRENTKQPVLMLPQVSRSQTATELIETLAESLMGGAAAGGMAMSESTVAA